MPKLHIAVFASGTGTNAENLFRYFKDHEFIKISLLVCNKQAAPVIGKAEKSSVPVMMVSREDWQEPARLVQSLKEKDIDFIVLAGFLWLIPQELVEAYPKRIVNIHPALLPKYGGRGMYGSKVHEAIKANMDTETGITIHYVDEHYDEGEVIFRAACPVSSAQSAEEIAACVHELEYEFYPKVVEELAAALYMQSEHGKA